MARGWISILTSKGLAVRYIITGLIVAALYGFLHLAIFSRLGLNRALSSMVALAIAIIFQYLMHSSFTFRGTWKSAPQLGRFGATILMGFFISHFIMAVIGPKFDLSDIVCAGLVMTLLPLANYFLFSVWVFTTNQNIDRPD